MKREKNLYFQSVYKRTNFVTETALGLFLAVSSVPRLLLEVFIRKNFGERYFSLAWVLACIIVLAIIPAAYAYYQHQIWRVLREGTRFHILGFLGTHLTWYLYLAWLLAVSLNRRQEIKRLPSVFDFGRASTSTGEIHPAFLNFKFRGKGVDIRQIETLVEPAFFLVIGLALCIFHQSVGLLIVACSLLYSLSYAASYYQGDQFIMDRIDERIFTEELAAAFVDEKGPSETRGVRYPGRKPADPETRRRIADTFIEFEEVPDAL